MRYLPNPSPGIFCAALLLGVGGCCGKLCSNEFHTSIITIPVVVGSTEEVPTVVLAGKKLGFGVHIKKYEYSSENAVTLNVELLSDGKVVGTMKCRGFEFRSKGGRGQGWEVSQQQEDCSSVVPAGGITALRVGTGFLLPDYPPKLEGVEIFVRSN